jgi:ornithine carbamoyltransferase
MTARHVLSLADLGPETLASLIEHSLTIAAGRNAGARPLAGKMVGIYFRGTSTRTRTAFTVGAMKLGAGTIAYGPHDLQLNTGETLRDTARVLSGYLDVLVIRTNGPLEEMQTLAVQEEMAIINAMSDNEHPTQAIADMTTIKEAFGRFDGIHALYLGEGNNSTAALALAVAMTPGMRLTIVTPEGYGLLHDALDAANVFAKKSGAIVEQHHEIARLPRDVDVVYTTRWETMGVNKPDPRWREHFIPYCVTPELMARVSKPSGTVFLHDLPAIRGSEVLDEVLDGPQSIAFRQAHHKLTSAMAILNWCVGDD